MDQSGAPTIIDELYTSNTSLGSHLPGGISIPRIGHTRGAGRLMAAGNNTTLSALANTTASQVKIW